MIPMLHVPKRRFSFLDRTAFDLSLTCVRAWDGDIVTMNVYCFMNCGMRADTVLSQIGLTAIIEVITLMRAITCSIRPTRVVPYIPKLTHPMLGSAREARNRREVGEGKHRHRAPQFNIGSEIAW